MVKFGMVKPKNDFGKIFKFQCVGYALRAVFLALKVDLNKHYNFS